MGEADLKALLEHHVELFNEAVHTGDYGEFLATFTDDAVMRFDGLPIGPLRGRAAIAAAYDDRPPADSMALTAMEVAGDDAVRVIFDWDSIGGGGQMYLRWDGTKVAEAVLTFG